LTLPRCPRSEDPAASALQARAFAWYLGVVLVGLMVLWAVVPRMAPGLGVVADALLPTILVFDALSLVALWRLPRLLRVLHVAQYASFFPILLGYLALTIALAPDAAARHAAIAAFGIWIPVVVTVTFQVFGSRDGLLGALAFVAATAVVVAGSVARGGALEGPGLAYVTMLVVASLAFAVIVYGAPGSRSARTTPGSPPPSPPSWRSATR
jgi:hypothetical protein